MINSWGAEIYPSPSGKTRAGQAILDEDPDSPGSLGIAISEAVEDAATHGDTNYSLGSVLNHVCLHQTVIGQECKMQMAMAGEEPDVVIGCFGGGSNFAGIALPYLPDKLNGSKVRLLAVEPTACPTLTRGAYEYDFGDVAGMTPLMMMYTLGHKFVPPRIHAGGLRYHGAAPLCSHLLKHGWFEAKAYRQLDVFQSAITFAQSEGIIPAPESSHAIHGAIEEALEAKVAGSKRVILFNLSGHGHFDMSAYENFLSGKLENFGFEAELKK
jgi:tryptophan synthase beta chain